MRFIKGYATNLIIDEKTGKVWRYGWGKVGNSIKRNYHWLQKVHSIIPTPKPLSLLSFGPLVISSETFIAGQALTPQQASGEHYNLIMATIAPLYQQTSLIHGDLTHRNILLNAGKVYFIDWDRAGGGPPEFDRWLLLADAQKAKSHRAFMQQLLHHPLSNSHLWPKFIVRCLAHSVADCIRRGKSLDWLDELK